MCPLRHGPISIGETKINAGRVDNDYGALLRQAGLDGSAKLIPRSKFVDEFPGEQHGLTTK